MKKVSDALRYAIGHTALGSILVAESDKGIAAILMGDDGAPLVDELRTRFPATILVEDQSALADLVARIAGLIERPTDSFDVTLDVRGTSFQREVWTALRRIPAGARVTYAEMAARIGRPEAVRAVAAACAANVIAVAIPCHRVVRTDGSLAGYRWGAARKRLLLEREALC